MLKPLIHKLGFALRTLICVAIGILMKETLAHTTAHKKALPIDISISLAMKILIKVLNTSKETERSRIKKLFF